MERLISVLQIPILIGNAPQSHSLRQIDLRPSGREIRFLIARDWSWDNGRYIGFGAGHILDQGHIANATPESHIYFRAGTRF